MNKLTYGRLCELAEKHGVTITENVRAFVRDVEQTDAAQAATEPIAWESTTFGYRKYLTQAQYERIGDRFRKWYKPYRCSACTNHEASAPGLSEEEMTRIAKETGLTEWLKPALPGEVLGPYTRAILTRASAATVAEPSKLGLTDDRLTEEKAAHIIERDGFTVTGYVMAMPDGRRCIVEKSAVRWLNKNQMWEVMHPSEDDPQQAEPSDWTTNECAATGQTCNYGPHGRHGETQCKYCGAKPAAQQQAEPGRYERSQQLGVFLRLADVVQADSKKTRDRYPAQSERADQIAAFMRTACKWAAQPGLAAALPDGCKLVPKEPTDAMLDRGAEAVVAARKIPLTGYGIAAHAWSAMYAAAPTHEHEARK